MSVLIMDNEDFTGLSSELIAFVQKLENIGIDRTRIFGLFFMLGLYTSAPTSEESGDAIYEILSRYFVEKPSLSDELINYSLQGSTGFSKQINEFCYRTGFEFSSSSILNPKNESLLDQNIFHIEKLSYSNKLFDSFLNSLGDSILNYKVNLCEAFFCGYFQMMNIGQLDINAAYEVGSTIKASQPVIYGAAIFAFCNGHIDYFIKLENIQIALRHLAGPLNIEYLKQLWIFQSYIFYEDGVPIQEVHSLELKHFHAWVLHNAISFDKDTYPNGLMPYSQSNNDLHDIPVFENISTLEECDRYINIKWGYTYDSLSNDIERLEYKGLIILLIYFSLTKSREKIS